MKHTEILLFDLSAPDSLLVLLRSFIEPHFKLSVLSSDGGVARDRPGSASGCEPDIILLTFSPDAFDDVIQLLDSLEKGPSARPIIAAADIDDPADLLRLLSAGVSDFVTPPFKASDILARIWRLLKRRQTEEPLIESLKEKLGLEQLIGKSAAFISEVRKIPIVARCDASVIISGETGTGKELCARALHYLSSRAAKPFVPVNCGAIPLELAENELFGHTRGAFTGASAYHPGLIEEAEGGTLFLDEIDCLPLQAQVKLLRFVQNKEYRPLGSAKTSSADVRIMAATNTDLEDAVKKGKLRQDLYYRLNIISLSLPPLRDRQEDIPLLAAHFLARSAAEFNKPAVEFSVGATQKLLTHRWPGNVRELDHVVQRAVVLSEGEVIEESAVVLSHNSSSEGPEPFKKAKARVIAQFEKRYIEGLLRSFGGNITRAAQASQKNRRAFWQLIRKHKIDVQSFRPSYD